MKRAFLGDSYDAVKRLWRDLLRGWAPLFAEPRFIPEELLDDFTMFTRIPLLDGAWPTRLSVLNDPDTGIRLPGQTNQAEGRKHIAIATIMGQLSDSWVQCVITFDQSHYRNMKLSRAQ